MRVRSSGKSEKIPWSGGRRNSKSVTRFNNNPSPKAPDTHGTTGLFQISLQTLCLSYLHSFALLQFPPSWYPRNVSRNSFGEAKFLYMLFWRVPITQQNPAILSAKKNNFYVFLRTKPPNFASLNFTFFVDKSIGFCVLSAKNVKLGHFVSKNASACPPHEQLTRSSRRQSFSRCDAIASLVASQRSHRKQKMNFASIVVYKR